MKEIMVGSSQPKQTSLTEKIAGKIRAKAEKSAPFSNQDVPAFLTELDQFENRAPKRELLVK